MQLIQVLEPARGRAAYKSGVTGQPKRSSFRSDCGRCRPSTVMCRLQAEFAYLARQQHCTSRQLCRAYPCQLLQLCLQQVAEREPGIGRLTLLYSTLLRKACRTLYKIAQQHSLGCLQRQPHQHSAARTRLCAAVWAAMIADASLVMHQRLNTVAKCSSYG